MVAKPNTSGSGRFKLNDSRISSSDDELTGIGGVWPVNQDSSAGAWEAGGTVAEASGAEFDFFADTEPAEDHVKVARYREAIPEIGRCIEAGFVCFLNPASLETEWVSAKMLDNPEMFYASPGISWRHNPFRHLLWNDCLMFEPIEEQQLTGLAAGYVQQLSDSVFCRKISRLLADRKPYAKINALILKSKHAAGWINYKEPYIENRVKKILADRLSYEKGRWNADGHGHDGRKPESPEATQHQS